MAATFSHTSVAKLCVAHNGKTVAPKAVAAPSFNKQFSNTTLKGFKSVNRYSCATANKIVMSAVEPTVQTSSVVSPIVEPVAPKAPEPIVKKTGKTVVITGGSQGVGRATALMFAKNGYNVVVAAREPERLEEVANEVDRIAGKGKGVAVSTDITSTDSVANLVEAVTSQFESVDLLINNAGVCCSGPFQDTTMDIWQQQMQVNCLGAVAVTQGLLPQIEAAKGSIVFVNSFGGVMPLNNMTAYTSSKYALAGFADALRYEMGPKGVHVAQVHPGVIKSDFMERAQFVGDQSSDLKDNMNMMLESGMGGLVQTPEQIAEAVMSVIVDRKSEHIEGPFFNVAVNMNRLFGLNFFALKPPTL